MVSRVVEYSEAFKRKVIEELEKGEVSTQQEAREKYGIKGSNTVARWLKRYGKEHLLPKRVRVEKMGERDQIKKLRRRIQELEKALADSQVQRVLSESYLEIACEEFGVEDVEEFKKKHDGELYIGAGKKKR